MDVILGSSSPRRRELLNLIISQFRVVSPDKEEHTKEKLPQNIVMDLARLKAEEVYLKVANHDLIISCDTIVYLDGEIFNKPQDSDDAFRMLKKLNGRTHEVYSGVCLEEKGNYYCFFDLTKVIFEHHTDFELYEYIDKYSLLDKAGAYGIQDDYLRYKIEGSLYNVIGLPVEKIKKELNKLEQKYVY